MKKSIIFLLFVIIASILVITAQLTGLIKLGNNNNSTDFANDNSGKIELVCDVEVARPVNGLGQPPETSRMTLAAGAFFSPPLAGILSMMLFPLHAYFFLKEGYAENEVQGVTCSSGMITQSARL